MGQDPEPASGREKVVAIKNRARKQSAQEFYCPVLQEIRAIKDAWRNHVMHSRRDYEPDEAVAILAHVNRFMTTLAAKVKEV